MAPDMIGTVMSTGSASPAVMRKWSSPDEVAFPLGAIFQALDTGKLLAAAPAMFAMAAAIVATSVARKFIRLLRQARPGGFRGALAIEKAIRLRP